MFRRLYRQRRRLIFGAGMFTLAIARGYGPQMWERMPAELSTGWAALALATTLLMVFGILLVLCAAFVLLLPSLRREIELLALLSLFAPAAIDLLPESLKDSQPWLPLLVFFGVAYGIVGVFWGLILDDTRLATRGGVTHRFHSTKPAEEVWAEIVPGEGPVSGHWQPNLTETRPVPGRPDELEMHFALGDGMFLHRHIRFVTKDKPHHCVYDGVEEVSARNSGFNAHRLDMRITPDPAGGCTVEWTEHAEVMRPRTALCMWFDDTVGDTVDHLRARHGGRRDWSMLGLGYKRVAQRA